MPHFDQEFFEQAEKLSTPEIIAEGAELREKARRLAGTEGIDAALQSHQLDALICPTNDPIGLDLPHRAVDVELHGADCTTLAPAREGRPATS